jgi:hypothetical protein
VIVALVVELGLHRAGDRDRAMGGCSPGKTSLLKTVSPNTESDDRDLISIERFDLGRRETAHGSGKLRLSAEEG